MHHCRDWSEYSAEHDWYKIRVTRRTPKTILYVVEGEDEDVAIEYSVKIAEFESWQARFAAQLLSDHQVRLMTVTDDVVTYTIVGGEQVEGSEESGSEEGGSEDEEGGSDGSEELGAEQAEAEGAGAEQARLVCTRCRSSQAGCSSCDPVKRAQAQAEREQAKADREAAKEAEKVRSAAAHQKRMAEKHAAKK